jgi:hypothetical protein
VWGGCGGNFRARQQQPYRESVAQRLLPRFLQVRQLRPHQPFAIGPRDPQARLLDRPPRSNSGTAPKPSRTAARFAGATSITKRVADSENSDGTRALTEALEQKARGLLGELIAEGRRPARPVAMSV